ncbi:MAG: hypothetical protein ACOY46_17155 [Bacillota bacterium]
MNYVEPLAVIEELDMDEQQLLLTCLFMTLGVEKIYEITVHTSNYLREKNRERAAEQLDRAAQKMIIR